MQALLFEKRGAHSVGGYIKCPKSLEKAALIPVTKGAAYSLSSYAYNAYTAQITTRITPLGKAVNRDSNSHARPLRSAKFL
jgi:hypothetical protein